jgi:Tat protein secretion system quality control protein TatD with DNase activity
MRMWDAATHMTKQQWAQTCERIQIRLENLRIENMDFMGTSLRKKKS